jgi:hypothetical protein
MPTPPPATAAPAAAPPALAWAGFPPLPGPAAPPAAPFPARLTLTDPAGPVPVRAGELAGWAHDLALAAHHLAHTAALPALGPGGTLRGTRRDLVELLTRTAARAATLATTSRPARRTESTR